MLPVMRYLTPRNPSPISDRSKLRPCPAAQPLLWPVHLSLMTSTLQVALPRPPSAAEREPNWARLESPSTAVVGE